MSESVIYRPEANKYMSVTDVRRTILDSTIPVTSCEKFFPGIIERTRSILYKGQSFPVDINIPSITQLNEHVVFFARSPSGTLELVAIGVTERVDGILENEPERV